jgi:hypothetical protein
MTATPLVYRYRPQEDGAPERIGWCPGVCNRNGIMLIGARTVPADWKPDPDPNRRPGVSDEPKYVFEAGKPFQCVEGSELHQFVRSSPLFRKVPSNELRLSASGDVISIEEPAKTLAERERTGHRKRARGPIPVGRPSRKQSSPKLLRHAETHGKRSGNSP